MKRGEKEKKKKKRGEERGCKYVEEEVKVRSCVSEAGVSRLLGLLV